ncbi:MULTISPECIES: hypothetical protein [Microbacterium]|uniref:hypothetical protein n=1 Tax=Microbacterium TaxID=33882 RepID=UPI001CC2C3B2|nr:MULTISPECIES: hypothetical protein [Microbacterium]
MSFPTARWCRSRRGTALCTRPTGHAGLHNRVGTSQMWSDAQADAPTCPGSGLAGVPAPQLPDEAAAAGFPEGRSRCPECDGFVPLVAGRRAPHDRFRGTDDQRESAGRAEWFNTFGWQ